MKIYFGGMFRVVFVLTAFLLLFRVSYADRDSLQVSLPDSFDYKNPKHYMTLASKYVANHGTAELGRFVIEKGLIYGKEIKNDTLIVMMNYCLADYYYYKEDYPKSFDLYNQVLPKFEELKDTLMIAKTFASFGLIFGYRNDDENSLKYYLKEVELLNKVRNKTSEINTERLSVLTNIINKYRSTKQYEKVIEQAPSAFLFASEIGDTVRMGTILNSLGMAYKNMDQIEKSLKTLRQAETLFDGLGDEFRKAFVLINIGGVYDYIHQPNSSLGYYNDALKIFRNKGYVYGQLNALTGLAGVYALQNKDNDASKIYQRCIDTAKLYGFNDIILESYSAMADIEYQSGNYKQAFDFKELHNKLNDSIFSVEKNKQYAELQTRYETIQKENEINLLKSEKLLRESELRRNKLWNWIVLTITIILSIFIYIGFVFYNQKKKANSLLTEKNNQIESKNIQLSNMNQQMVLINEKLQQSQVELTNANHAKNRFFSILGHDLRNPFHSIMGQSYLLSKSYDKLSSEERRKYANDILNSCEQVNRLLDNLLEWTRTQSEGITFNPRELEFYQLVLNSLSVLSNNAHEKSIKIVNNVDKNIKIVADYPMIETIMRNLVNNGIKFTPEGGTVTVSAELLDHELQVNVTDNGVGIPKNIIDKLFNVDSNIKTRGTNNERGTGLGLVICKEFIDFHNGKIWAESEPGKGTTFHLLIPARC